MIRSNTKPSEISLRLCRNVRILAKEQRIKMKDIETALGLANGYFCRCEQNSNAMRIDTVCALAELFGVTVDELLSADLEKKLKVPLARATLADAIETVSEVFSKEEIVRIISEEM